MRDAGLDIQETAQGVLIKVKVVPGASRNRLAGVLDGALKVAVAAPPEKGKANKSLIKLLADLLEVPKNRLSVQQGKTSPHKVLLVEGVSKHACLQKLGIDS